MQANQYHPTGHATFIMSCKQLFFHGTYYRADTDLQTSNTDCIPSTCYNATMSTAKEHF